MEILVFELTGPALDWAAVRADGWCPAPNYFDIPTFIKGVDRRYAHQFKYSTDWSQGGPIIEQEKIEIYYQSALEQWAARCADSLRYGPTPLIAAMRSFVAHRIGDVVDVPDELAACDVARPSTPVGWSDTDWIKHLQDQEPHPLAGLHINQGSMNAAADAYEAEYNAAQEARRAEHDAARKEGCMTEDRDDRIERATLRDEALLRQALEALIWTTGSEDFGEGGLAREGALKLLFPTIAALRERLSKGA